MTELVLPTSYVDFADKIVSVEKNIVLDGTQVLFKFTNGYEGSVVRHSGSYGGTEGLFELGVFNPDGGVDYDNPATRGDVAGWLSPAKVIDKLRIVAHLPGKVKALDKPETPAIEAGTEPDGG